MNFLSCLAAWTYARALKVPTCVQLMVELSVVVGGACGCQRMASTSCLRQTRGGVCGRDGEENRNWRPASGTYKPYHRGVVKIRWSKIS